MNWNLRYGPHLGYRPPFEPLYRHLVGNDDPVAHVEFAAAQGFAGVLYAAARARSAQEQQRVGRAIAACGLEAGCILYTTFDQVANTSWARDDASCTQWIDAELRQAGECARRVGARRLAVLGGAQPDVPIERQRATFVRHLQRAARWADGEGLVLCLEPLNRRRVPGMLLHHLPEAFELLHEVGHAAVRLIFDTAHVQSMDGDLLWHLEQAWEFMEIVQLADNPGRFEPGSGEINVGNLLRALVRRGWRGLVELEHGWSQPGIEAERRGIEALRALDTAAAAAAG